MGTSTERRPRSWARIVATRSEVRGILRIWDHLGPGFALDRMVFGVSTIKFGGFGVVYSMVVREVMIFRVSLQMSKMHPARGSAQRRPANALLFVSRAQSLVP